MGRIRPQGAVHSLPLKFRPVRADRKCGPSNVATVTGRVQANCDTGIHSPSRHGTCRQHRGAALEHFEYMPSGAKRTDGEMRDVVIYLQTIIER